MRAPFTIIVEYFNTETELSGMETSKRQSLRSAQYYARKNLRTMNVRPNRVPECARVEDVDENIVARYTWDGATESVQRVQL